MVQMESPEVPDLKIELERSDYINHRNELMKNLQIPKLSEAKATLGEPLAKIVFDECDEALKVDFGLKPPLKGALGDLWVSPSDLLIGKVTLKPPTTRKYIQALTHQGIINIGADIEQKFLNEAASDKERTLAIQKKNLLDSFEDSTKAEIKDVEARERAAGQREIERITQEFETTLIEELDKLQKKMEAEFNYLNQNQEKLIQEKWERKLEQEVQKTVNIMTEEFLQELARHEEILSKCMKAELSKAEVKRQFDLGIQAADFRENIDQLKRNLECKNIANMMYILCMERRKCCDEKAVIEKYYKEEIAKLKELVSKKNTEINSKVNDLKKQMEEVNLRETCVLEILKQFQKFINFALKAAPTQAEFLLSVEKMMVFELTHALTKFEIQEPSVPCEENLPWCIPKEHSETLMTDLHIQDFHNCFNEILPPDDPNEEPDVLPSFHYKNKLYVREDFRNMISQGIRVSSSNELWSKDVDILMDTLRKSVHSLHSDKQEGTRLSERSSKKSVKGRIDSKLQFKASGKQSPKRVSLEKKSLGLPQKHDKVSLKPSRQPSLIDYTKIGYIENKPILLGTKSSVEMLLSKGSIKQVEKQHERPTITDSVDENFENRESYGPNGDKLKLVKKSIAESIESMKIIPEEPPLLAENPKETTDLILDERDSIIQNKLLNLKKSNDFNTQPKDSIEVVKESLSKLGIKPSKLLQTKDSVELLHESLMKIHDSKGNCINRESVNKSKSSSFGRNLSQLCCDKCQKSIRSEEVIKDTRVNGKTKKSLEGGAIKVSHIEVINIVDYENKSAVAFNTVPIVHEEKFSSDCGLDALPDIYKDKDDHKISQSRKKKQQNWRKKPPTVKVIGERGATEYLQTITEFTEDRIQSFISLIKDHPNLIRTFTACNR